MFIREYKQSNKKTGEVYIKHKLVASVRTENGPRQRVIMPLGTLTVPRIDWKRLAHALECRITGQQSLLSTEDADLELLALKLVSNHDLSKSLELLHETSVEQPVDKYVSIDLDSVRMSETRGLGAEVLCHRVWDLLGFADILKSLRFSPASISLVMVLLFGRMISPGSERHTIEWFRKRSALQELPGVYDLSKCSKDRFYEVADELFVNKERIEDLLYLNERELFPHSEATVYLYDITNTYLEGHGLGNTLAERGHCKSKRFDCPLISLSLVVSDDGMPVCSQIYKGNQSEPETMQGIMRRLSERMHGSQIPMFKPTVVMDRGIATADNVAWLRDNNYYYIVIKREDDCGEYRRQFESERNLFELVSSKRSIYGDENNVYIRKEPVEGDMCRVLCYSEGKARKEKAIADKRCNAFPDEIKRFRSSILKGTIKKSDKIIDKLQRIIDKNRRLAASYDVELVYSEDKVTDITCSKKPNVEEPLYGCYVIESSHSDMSAGDLWNLYMTLSRVESAFRSMKETLGLRPIYHQSAERSSAHLFITVLAYHLLATLENLLSKYGDTRSWLTLRDVMSTLMRGTVSMRDNKGASFFIRVSGEPEAEHQAILNSLCVRSLPASVISVIDTL